MAGVFNGRKNIEADGTGATWQPNGNSVIDLGRYQGKRNLATILVITGIVSASVTTATTKAETLDISYKDDHFYNLLSNVQIRLNGSTEVKNVQSLTCFRILNTLQNRGKFEYNNIPLQVTIPQGATKGTAPFELVIVIPYSMFDMIQATQCNIPTWLFSSFQMSFKNEIASSVFAATSNNGSITANINIDTAYINCSAKYWQTGAIQATSQEDYLDKMGNLYVQKTITKGFGGGGKGQYMELTPNIWVKDFTLIFRNSRTNERIDGFIDRIRISDGSQILVDTSPAIIKNDMISRFSLSKMLFERELADSPDGKGLYYGVYRIDSNYFGEMNNSRVFASWNQPRLTLDLNDDVSSVISTGEEIVVEVVQSYEETPQLLRQLAQAEANAQAARQG